MNNILASAQRFFKNKNVITIIGVIAILVLLYFGYSSQINKAVEPVQIPVAAETIQPRTEITDDMINIVDMPNISLTDNVIRLKSNIVGKYSNVNTVIPEGSMFYTDTVIEKAQLPDSIFLKVKKGEMIYQFPVNMETSFGNSIFPGNKIDIYMKIGNGNDEKIMLGKLVENVEVLAVRDNSGRDVFENSEENRTPAYLLFGLPEDINLLLQKASYMGSLGVDLYPIPHGGAVVTEGATELSTQQLVDYIEAHSVNLPTTTTTNETTETDKLLPTIKTTGTTTKSVAITYPKGCGSKYTCTYVKNTGKETNVKKTKVTTSFTSAGTITATVIEKDGTAHTVTEEITFAQTATDGTTPNTTNPNATAGR